jgi:hypothetical protein
LSAAVNLIDNRPRYPQQKREERNVSRNPLLEFAKVSPFDVGRTDGWFSADALAGACGRRRYSASAGIFIKASGLR